MIAAQNIAETRAYLTRRDARLQTVRVLTVRGKQVVRIDGSWRFVRADGSLDDAGFATAELAARYGR